jgi:protein-tyrosine kinase
MSFIETAIKKIQASGAPSSPVQPRTAPQQPNARRVKSPVRPDAPDRKSVRQFKRATFDAEAMERNCIFPQLSDQSALRSYKILRTRLLQRMVAGQWSSVAVTGTDSGQGKTLTAINLAFALAQDPSTYVFLVDLDLQRPQLGLSLGMDFDKGLGEYLLGEAEIDDIIYDAGSERLAVIPNGRAFEHSSELLASDRMLRLRNALDSEVPKRIVIYDMPPLLLSDDVLTFGPQVDGLLLVVSEGLTARNSVERAKEILSEMNLLGVVLNRSHERNDSGYY